MEDLSHGCPQMSQTINLHEKCRFFLCMSKYFTTFAPQNHNEIELCQVLMFKR